MLDIIPLPALKEHYNYIWLLKNKASNHIAIVDPGEAGPLLELIETDNLIPVAILITHHHWDHVNGIEEITAKYDIPVYTPKTEEVKGSTHPVGEGDTISLPELELELSILDVPGHTLGAIAYYAEGMVFSGDTLFAGGCGRLFEGSPMQMQASLSKFTRLPDETLLYCGHEYTVSNLKFALTVEPKNENIKTQLAKAEALRAEDKPTVPTTIKNEKETNPFLRCERADVILSAARNANFLMNSPADVFKAIREWKNNF